MKIISSQFLNSSYASLKTLSHKSVKQNLYKYINLVNTNLTNSLSKINKLLVIIVAGLALSSCSSLSFNNIPNVEPGLKYLTISSSNSQVLLQTTTQLIKDGYIIIDSQSSPQQLQQAITEIKQYRLQLEQLKAQSLHSNSDNNSSNHSSTTNSSNQNLTLLNSEQKFQVNSGLSSDDSIITSSEFDSPTDVIVDQKSQTKTAQSKTNNHSFTILSLPTAQDTQKLPQVNNINQVVDITQCQNQLLTYTCVSKFLPRLQLDSYSTITKNLSLFTSGSYAQRTVLSNLNATLTIPKLGSISLYTLNSDLQFTNGATQLGTTVKNKIFDKLNLESAVSTLVNRVEFILQAQTYKLKH